MSLQDKTRVGMIGLGLMGRALAEAAMAGGFPVTVWNRTRAKAESLEKAGALVAASVPEVARDTDILVVCLLDHAATRATVMTEDVATALTGKALIQLSTTGAQEAEELARWAEGHGIAFLKGAILDYPEDIRAGTGEILYGGPRSLFERLRGLLDALGGRPILITERPADVIAPTDAYYAFLYSCVLGFLHGAAICHRGGVPVEVFTRSIVEPIFTGGSMMRLLDSVGRAAADRRYDDDLQATLDVWNDALRQTIENIEDAGIETATLQPFKALLDRTAESGHGQKDIAAVFETLIAEKP